MKSKLHRNKQFILASLIFSIFGTGAAFALPYTPTDQELDPSCAPGATDCYVSLLNIGTSVLNATSGSILFADSSGNLAQDNSNLFFDDTNNRLGIGTNTPESALHVVGDVTANNVSLSLQINPTELATISLPASPRLQAFSVNGNYLYSTSGSSNNLLIYDITMPSSPVLVSDTASMTSGLNDSARAVAGDLLVLSQDSGKACRVIDVSNPSTPSILATSSSSTDSIGSWQDSQIVGSFVYAMGERNNFIICNISNPKNPVVASTIQLSGSTGGVSGGGSRMKVVGKYLYTITTSNQNLNIVDISNPYNPTIIATLALGSSFNTMDVSGRYIYAAGSSTMIVIDISSKTNPQIVATIANTGATGSPGNSIVVQGKYMYKEGSGSQIRVYDISDAPNGNLTLVQNISTTSVSSNLRNLYISGNYLFTGFHTDNKIAIYDIGGIRAPAISVGTIDSTNIKAQGDLNISGNINALTGLYTNALFASGNASFGSKITANPTYTAVSDNDFLWNFGGIATATNTSSHILNGALINPSFTLSSSGVSQTVNAMHINASYSVPTSQTGSSVTGLQVTNSSAISGATGGVAKYGLRITQSGTLNRNIGTYAFGLYVDAYSGSVYEPNTIFGVRSIDAVSIGATSLSSLNTTSSLLRIADTGSTSSTGKNTIYMQTGSSSTVNLLTGITVGAANASNLTGALHWVNTGITRETNLLFKLSNDGSLTTRMRIFGGTGNIAVGSASDLGRLGVVGSGSTSSTYTAQFHNSTGTSNSLVIRDDGNVGVGTNAPTGLFEINSGTGASGGYFVSFGGYVDNYRFGNTVRYQAFAAGGTSLAPTAFSGSFFTINGNAYNGTSYTNNARIDFYTNETQTVSAAGSNIRIQNVLNGATARTTAIDIIGTGSGYIQNNYSTGIGTTGAPNYKLEVGNNSVSGIVARFVNSTGTCDINPTTTSLSCSSDLTLKKNITDLDSSLSLLTQLRTVTYNWNTQDDNTTKTPGFIAQEVEQVFPFLVTTDPTTNLKSLNYTLFTPYIIKSIQEINANFTSLDASKENTLGYLIKKFLEDSLNGLTKIFVGEIKGNRAEFSEYCAPSGRCLTGQDIDALLNLVGSQNNSNPSNNPPENNSASDDNSDIEEDGEVVNNNDPIEIDGEANEPDSSPEQPVSPDTDTEE